MTIEEKAKAYDDAVNYAKEVLDGLAEDYRCTYMTKDAIRNQYSRMFPNEVAFHDDEDSFANRKLIYGLKSLLQQGKETFAGADIEDLIDYLERKKSEKVVGVTVNGEPVSTEAKVVTLTPEQEKKFGHLFTYPRQHFTEGEVKVLKEIIDYLEYRGMEDYYESLENLILKYGENKQ